MKYITLDIIQSNPDKLPSGTKALCNLDTISNNPNITLSILINHGIGKITLILLLIY